MLIFPSSGLCAAQLSPVGPLTLISSGHTGAAPAGQQDKPLDPPLWIQLANPSLEGEVRLFAFRPKTGEPGKELAILLLTLAIQKQTAHVQPVPLHVSTRSRSPSGT